jgi:cardiolipin synthase
MSSKSREVRGKAELHISAVLDWATSRSRRRIAGVRPHRIPKRFRTIDQRFVEGNRVELLRDGAESYPSMLAAIHGAERQVLFEMYWFDSDRTGREFATALAEAAARGVEVAVIYDAVGSIGTSPGQFDEMARAGAKVLLYNPLSPWQNRFRLGRLTRRDHRKLLVVDGRIGFTGGINVADAWLGLDEQGGGGWRDDMVRVEGPAVQEMAACTMTTWRRAGGAPLNLSLPAAAAVGDVRVRTLCEGYPGKRQISHEYVARLYRARERVYIRNAYFVPDRATRRALRRAAQRGVDVRVLMPGQSDVEIVRHASRATWGPLLRSGVKLFEWQPTIMHAKSAVIDGTWSTIGTYNFDYLSLRTNLEVNAAIEDAAFGALMERSFEEDFASSREIDRASFRFRPLGERLFEWVAYRFRRFL